MHTIVFFFLLRILLINLEQYTVLCKSIINSV